MDLPRHEPTAALERIRVADGGIGTPSCDAVAVEEPLEIRLAGAPLAVVMRTPGDDFDLACGFALTERAVAAPDDLAGVHFGDPAEFNVVDVAVRPGAVRPDDARTRHGRVTSACGVCGAATLDEVMFDTPPLHRLGPDLAGSLLVDLPRRLRGAQPGFEVTGGVHAAGAFTAAGDTLVVREDVGRHNAVDKVIGHLARGGRLPAHDLVLGISGRAGFEIVQKCAVAGICVLVAVSAPTSLAVALAEQSGITLAAFVRDGSANLYAHPERVLPG